jgi:hypothetical protein
MPVEEGQDWMGLVTGRGRGEKHVEVTGKVPIM